MYSIRWHGIALCGLILGTSSSAHAAPPGASDLANEVSSDAAQCAAFFEISATCAANTDAMATAADLLEHRKVMEKIAFLMGKASGMSVEGVQARFATVSDAELESISRSCVNFSVLLHRYGRACRDFEAHPEQRMTDLRSHGLGTAWPNGLPD